jgi:hypothetical protein
VKHVILQKLKSYSVERLTTSSLESKSYVCLVNQHDRVTMSFLFLVELSFSIQTINGEISSVIIFESLGKTKPENTLSEKDSEGYDWLCPPLVKVWMCLRMGNYLTSCFDNGT